MQTAKAVQYLPDVIKIDGGVFYLTKRPHSTNEQPGLKYSNSPSGNNALVYIAIQCYLTTLFERHNTDQIVYHVQHSLVNYQRHPSDVGMQVV